MKSKKNLLTAASLSVFAMIFVAVALFAATAMAITPDEQTNPTPEPATLVLLGAGMIGLGVWGKKRNKKHNDKEDFMRRISMLLAIIFLSLVSNAYAIQYSIIDLGVYAFSGGANDLFCSYAINNSGQIAGNSPSGAFLWDNGQKTYLGVEGVSDINDLGQILYSRAIWQNGVIISEFFFQNTFEINNSGQFVGAGYPSGPNPRASIFDNGSVTNVATAFEGRGSYHPSFAFGINDVGQVVGKAYDTNGQWHGFIWDNGVTTDLYNVSPVSINNKSQIVGTATASNGNYQAFLYENGLNSDLGTLDGGNYSIALEINDLGQAVGKSKTATGQDHAFLWDKIAGMVDLNTLTNSIDDWTLSAATDINEKGQIVGYGLLNGESHGFLLNPSEPLSNPTPEPSSMILLGAGMLGVGIFTRRFKKNKIS
jgi:probable HAF family extracellular repeat protein